MSRPAKSIPGKNPFHEGLKKRDLTCYFLQRDEYDMTKHYRNGDAFREGLTRLRYILGLCAYFCEEHRTPDFENFLHDWNALKEKYINDPRTHRAWLRDPREHHPLLRDILYILLLHGPDIWPVRDPEVASDEYDCPVDRAEAEADRYQSALVGQQSSHRQQSSSHERVFGHRKSLQTPIHPSQQPIDTIHVGACVTNRGTPRDKGKCVEHPMPTSASRDQVRFKRLVDLEDDSAPGQRRIRHKSSRGGSSVSAVEQSVPRGSTASCQTGE